MSILGVGDADVDIFIEVEKVPAYDEKVFCFSLEDMFFIIFLRH